MAVMDTDLLAKYDRNVPRYTSYPTAPHFHDGIGPQDYGAWLAETPTDEPLSAYLHIPFCDSLCWFCGCHTKIVRRYQPVARYLDVLQREIELVADRLGTVRPLAHVQFGGGSPSLLHVRDIASVMAALHGSFSFTAGAELAVEIDPRDIDRARIAAWAEAGMTRASLGVQDFEPEVQRAINREQSIAETARVVDWLRASGVDRLNIDVMYGLPLQTVASALRTVELVLTLAPNRIAAFGYAHVPWMKRHQRMIADDTLPGTAERWRQSEAIAGRLAAAGYVRIGLYQFARADDALALALAAGTLRRNFQGYTTDGACTLIGLGASAIGSLPAGYVQNLVPAGRYGAAIANGQLATTRGLRLDDEDRRRRAMIEQLMCFFEVDLTAGARSPAAAMHDEERLKLAEMAATASSRSTMAGCASPIPAARSCATSAPPSTGICRPERHATPAPSDAISDRQRHEARPPIHA